MSKRKTQVEIAIAQLEADHEVLKRKFESDEAGLISAINRLREQASARRTKT